MPAATTAAKLFTRMLESEGRSAPQGVIRPQQMKQEFKYQENTEQPAQPNWPYYADLGPVKPLNDVKILIASVDER